MANNFLNYLYYSEFVSEIARGENHLHHYYAIHDIIIKCRVSLYFMLVSAKGGEEHGKNR
jgi:hypothetical protein